MHVILLSHIATLVCLYHGSNNHRGDSGGRKVGDDAVQYLRECSDNEEKLRYVIIVGLDII